MPTLQRTYISRLDHLRFFAASLVLVFHFFHTHQGDLRHGNPIVSFIDEGHSGIALFMVLSGFIFTTLAGNLKLDYWGFIRNRVLRIYPLFVFAVFLQLFFSTYNDQRNYGLLQLLGWLVPFRSDTVPLSPYFVQLWTIWVEFQFYLIFPFLLLFSRRFGSRYLWGLLALLLVVRALIFAASGSVRFLAYETIFGRLDQFIVGMLVARLYLAKFAINSVAKTEASIPAEPVARVLNPSLSPLWLLVSVLILVLGLHAFSWLVGFSELASPLWIVWPVIEATLWAAFLWAYLAARWPGPLGLKNKVDSALAGLGSLSFSVYVMHNLVIAAYNARLPLLPVPGTVTLQAAITGAFVVLPFTLCLSVLTYWLIERPFLAMRSSYLSHSVSKTTNS